ncbi:hypothetical protein [Actinokineospora sp.]
MSYTGAAPKGAKTILSGRATRLWTGPVFGEYLAQPVRTGLGRLE